jgi:glutathione synthase/RimK-type ligase-like ATP-grasp enzyme
LRSSSSSFIGRPTDIIINWGIPRTVHNSTYYNPIESVRIAACKLKTFRVLQSAGISIPDFSVSKPTEGRWVARLVLNGNSGQGAVVADAPELPDAPLYTRYIKKDAEYRVIVVAGQAVDVKQKLKRRDFTGERLPYIWNCDNGYIFARDVDIPDYVTELGIASVQALGLRTGAVDIIVKDGIAYTLEVNSAFGLSGTTIQLVGDAIKADLCLP